MQKVIKFFTNKWPNHRFLLIKKRRNSLDWTGSNEWSSLSKNVFPDFINLTIKTWRSRVTKRSSSPLDKNWPIKFVPHYNHVPTYWECPLFLRPKGHCRTRAERRSYERMNSSLTSVHLHPGRHNVVETFMNTLYLVTKVKTSLTLLRNRVSYSSQILLFRLSGKSPIKYNSVGLPFWLYWLFLLVCVCGFCVVLCWFSSTIR